MLCQREQRAQGLGVLMELGLPRTCKGKKKSGKKMHLKDFLKYVSITLVHEEEKCDVEKPGLVLRVKGGIHGWLQGRPAMAFA